jgi:hypothetical protein
MPHALIDIKKSNNIVTCWSLTSETVGLVAVYRSMEEQ